MKTRSLIRSLNERIFAMSQRLADLQEAPQPLVTYEAVEVEILKNRIESLGYRL